MDSCWGRGVDEGRGNLHGVGPLHRSRRWLPLHRGREQASGRTRYTGRASKVDTGSARALVPTSLAALFPPPRPQGAVTGDVPPGGDGGTAIASAGQYRGGPANDGPKEMLKLVHEGRIHRQRSEQSARGEGALGRVGGGGG